MNDLLLVVGDYLKGKTIIPQIRRILNFIFTISITSFFYERIIGPYSWIEITDYKGILDFFVKGNFYVPLFMYVIVYVSISLLSYVLFDIFVNKKSVKWTEKIIKYELIKKVDEDSYWNIGNANSSLAKKTIDKSRIKSLYDTLTKKFGKEEVRSLEKALSEAKKDLSSNFTLIIRGLIAIIIYFFTIDEVGVVILLISLMVLVGIGIILRIVYVFLDVIPALARKLRDTVVEFFEEEVE
ncbi:hypothetical protein [uncultured Draconibacterium sp.]|uniref:hypothetical protein n=1 Tax=uncultured Draconibacterium sp. TaxID=1573823 RepID=UPI0029C7FDF1|nr:hypothetical protein [uncultured Draconibacterium sp.]